MQAERHTCIFRGDENTIESSASAYITKILQKFCYVLTKHSFRKGFRDPDFISLTKESEDRNPHPHDRTIKFFI